MVVWDPAVQAVRIGHRRASPFFHKENGIRIKLSLIPKYVSSGKVRPVKLPQGANAPKSTASSRTVNSIRAKADLCGNNEQFQTPFVKWSLAEVGLASIWLIPYASSARDRKRDIRHGVSGRQQSHARRQAPHASASDRAKADKQREVKALTRVCRTADRGFAQSRPCWSLNLRELLDPSAPPPAGWSSAWAFVAACASSTWDPHSLTLGSMSLLHGVVQPRQGPRSCFAPMKWEAWNTKSHATFTPFDAQDLHG